MEPEPVLNAYEVLNQFQAPDGTVMMRQRPLCPSDSARYIRRETFDARGRYGSIFANPMRHAAAEILSHPLIKRRYDRLLREDATGGTNNAQNYFANAQRFVQEELFPPRAGYTRSGVARGIPTGVLIGMCAHGRFLEKAVSVFTGHETYPATLDLLEPTGGASPWIDAASFIANRAATVYATDCDLGGKVVSVIINMGTLGVTGAVLGGTAGLLYGSVKPYRLLGGLSLPPDSVEQHIALQRVGRKISGKAMSLLVLGCMAGGLIDNAITTYQEHQACEARALPDEKEQELAIEDLGEGEQEQPPVDIEQRLKQEPKYPEVLTITPDFDSWRIRSGDMLYAIACGEGIEIARPDGRLRNPKRIFLPNGKSLRDEVRDLNPDMRNLNVMRKGRPFSFRDWNENGKLDRYKPKDWRQCQKNAHPKNRRAPGR